MKKVKEWWNSLTKAEQNYIHYYFYDIKSKRKNKQLQKLFSRLTREDIENQVAKR